MKMKPFIWLLIATMSVATANAQRVLTMESAIEISITGSPELQKSALSLERYKKLLDAENASLKTQFSLDLDPLSYSQSREFDPRLSERFTNQNMSSSGTLSIAQPIVWTGAEVSLSNTFGWRNNISELPGQGDFSDKAFSNSLNLSLSQPLFTYNKLRQALNTIEMNYDNALIDYALARLTLEQSITTLFYAVYMAQENLQISEEALKNEQQNYDVMKNKVDLDLEPRAELFQAEINFSNAQSEVDNDVIELEYAKDELKQQLGLSINEDITISADVTVTSVPIDPEVAIDNALLTRLELRQREITNKLAEYTLIRIKDQDKFQGSLSLSVGIMGDDPRFNDVYSNPLTNPRVALTFKVPIFDWGARRDRIKAQEIMMQRDLIDEEQELIDIELDVRQTCRKIDNLTLQIEIAKKNVVNAQQTYDLNVLKYREGNITGMVMNDEQKQLSTQKQNLAQRMIDYRIELLNLKVVSLYDFENNEPISPLLLYSPETNEKVNKHKRNRK